MKLWTCTFNFSDFVHCWRGSSGLVPQRFHNKAVYSWYRYCTVGPPVNCHLTAWPLLSFVVVVDVCFLSRMSWHCRSPSWNFESVVESTGSSILVLEPLWVRFRMSHFTVVVGRLCALESEYIITFRILNAVAGYQFVFWKRVCRGTILVATGGTVCPSACINMKLNGDNSSIPSLMHLVSDEEPLRNRSERSTSAKYEIRKTKVHDNSFTKHQKLLKNSSWARSYVS